MGRGGAAAAAHHPHAQGDHLLVVARHLRRRGGKDRLPVPQLGKAGVGLGDQGAGGDGAHLLQDREDPLGPEPAVGADHIGSEGVEGHRGGLGRGAEDRAAAVVEGHLGDDRQAGEAAAGHHGGPQLADIEKGFQGDQVGAGVGEGRHLLGENLHHLIEERIAHRLEEAAGGTDGSRHEPLPAGSPAGDLHRPGVDLGHPVLQGVMGQLEPTAAEGVGDKDVGAGLGVLPVNALDHLRRHQVHLFGAAAGLEAAGLQHRAHGPVENQDPLLYRLQKISHCRNLPGDWRMGVGLHLPEAGRRPSGAAPSGGWVKLKSAGTGWRRSMCPLRVSTGWPSTRIRTWRMWGKSAARVSASP